VTLHRASRIAAGLMALALVPLTWKLGFDALPSWAEIRTANTDVAGVWIFTWLLIWLATFAGIAIAWASWAFDRADRRDVEAARRHVA
jgi:hypothetical protein